MSCRFNVYTIFAVRMASVLVSRLLLDLQDAYLRSIILDSRRPLSTVCVVDDHAIRFARVAGSLGATINPDAREDVSDDGGDGNSDSQNWAMDDDDDVDNVDDFKV